MFDILFWVQWGLYQYVAGHPKGCHQGCPASHVSLLKVMVATIGFQPSKVWRWGPSCTICWIFLCVIDPPCLYSETAPISKRWQVMVCFLEDHPT